MTSRIAQRTPVLVGISQILQRTELAEAQAPLTLMREALRTAGVDCGAPEIFRSLESIRVIQGVWGYTNPAHALAQDLGLGPVECGLSVLGGNHVQLVLNRSAAEIALGEREAVALVGAECGRSLGHAQKAGVELPWLEAQSDRSPAPDVVYGDARWTRHEAELARGIEQAVHYYSLFELALRHHLGDAPAEHLQRISELWAGFSQVAQGNPNAWLRQPFTAEQIRTPSPSNRPVTYPYPKLMNANMRVDMAACLLLVSERLANRLGIAPEQRVYPLSGTDAYDHYFVSERENLYSSPAIRLAGRRALELAQVEIGDLTHVDLYSCFPSAVQIAARELGLSQDRPLTVTGGLTFGGGPLNNYVMHSIARTAEVLREEAASGTSAKALVTANGGMLTKHAFGVYSNAPPERPYREENLQSEVDALPRRELAVGVKGQATIESYVVVYGAGGRTSGSGADRSAKKTAASIYAKRERGGSEPTVAHLACLLPDGRRTWVNVEEAEVLEGMCEEDFCGREVFVDGEGGGVVV